MRLTLRTLLAYLDDTLEPAQARTIGQKVAESDTAQELITRIKQVTRRRRLTTPPDSGPNAKLDSNTIAEYLDNTLDADQLAEVEQICLASDVHLAEMASCHQILTLVLGEPALVPPTAKQRMYGLVKGREAIAFRKPPPLPRSADADEPQDEGKEVDETLRLGVPALRSKDPWANRLILMAGAFGLVACLVVAILMLVIPGGPDDADGPAPGKDGNAVARFDDRRKKNEDDKGADAGQLDKKGKRPPLDDGKDAGKQEKKIVPKDQANDGKGKGKEVGDDGPKVNPDHKQGEKVVERPKQPAETPPGPPSKRVVEIGTYEPPPPPAIAVLLQARPGGKSDWQRLERQLKPVRVVTGRPLVSLPAFRSVVKTDHGVRLTLVGTVPEFFPGLPLYESRVVLHQHDALDLDLTLERGRILLTSTRPDRPVRVRVRFENTTDPQSGEMWDLTLENKDTEVLIDRWSFYVDEPFYENPKHPNRTGPRSSLGLIVLHGAVGLRADSVSYTLRQPPGPAMMFWDSKEGPRGPSPMKEAPPWARAEPPVPKGFENGRADMQRAATQLSITLSGRPVELGLTKALTSTELPQRKMAVRSFGALDMVPQMVDALGDENHPDVRLDAIETLRYWIAASRDNAYGLLTELQARYTAIESEKIVALLHSYSKNERSRPEMYGALIDQLISSKIAIRELAAWHLYQLVPDAQKQIPWAAASPPDVLRQTRAAWRKLIPQGKLPPQKGPAGVISRASGGLTRKIRELRFGRRWPAGIVYR